MLRKLIMTSAALMACILLTAAVPASEASDAPIVASMAPVAAPMATKALPAMVPGAMAVVPTMATQLAAQPVAAPVEPAKVAPGKPDSTASVVGGALLQILLVVLPIAIPIIVAPLIKWILKKMKVEDLQTQEMIDGIVDQGVVHGLNYANEQAHKLRDNPVAGAAKLDMAADKAIAYLKDSGIVDKGADYIKDLIEAKLGMDRDDVAETKEEAPMVDGRPVADDKPTEESKDKEANEPKVKPDPKKDK